MLCFELRRFWHLLTADYPFGPHIFPITRTAILRSKKATGGKKEERKINTGEENYRLRCFHGYLLNATKPTNIILDLQVTATLLRVSIRLSGVNG